MTIKEAKNKLERVDNQIEYWLKEKELELGNVLPQAVNTTTERVNGGKRVDKFVAYAVALEDKEIDLNLDKLYAKKRNLEDFIEKELRRLKKYREVAQLIVYYKEQCLENYTWEQIGQRVYMNKDNCRKIYRKWKGKRDI